MHMVTHVVIFTWIAGTTEVQITALGDAMTQLGNELSDLVTMRHGRDLQYREGNGDYALVATFSDQAAWNAYQAHASHKAFVRDFVTPIQASRLTVQF